LARTLSAVAGDGSVTLSWSAPADDGGSPVTGYQVLSATSAEGPYSAVGTPTTTSMVVTGLSNGTTYYIEVVAANDVGSSNPAGPVSATPTATTPPPPPPVTPPPPPPSKTVASPPGSPITVAGDGTVTLSWSAPADDGGSPVTGYQVLTATSPGGPYGVVGSPTGTSMVVNGLRDGTTYYFEVVAVNGVGLSAPTQPVSATPVIAPPPPPAGSVPSPPRSPSADVGDRTVRLTWLPGEEGGSPLLHYRVLRSIDGAHWEVVATPHASHVTLHGLRSGTRYYFQIEAVTSFGASMPSQVIALTAHRSPTAPRAVSIAAKRHAIVVRWKAPKRNGGEKVTSYVVQYAHCVIGSSGCVVHTRSAHGHRLTIRGLSSKRRYHVQVAARNQVGRGTYSALITSKLTRVG
jgi:titin